MTRHGKIARLPVAIREELNVRLENGEAGVRLVEWLNGLPEVKAVLAEYFEGQAISECNLTQWKNGGFRDWQAQIKAQSMVELWQLESPMSKVQSPKSGSGSQRSEDGSLRPEGGATVENVAAVLTERLMVHYAAALEDVIGEPGEPRKRVKRLGQSLRDVVRLRRYELAKERAELERERIELQRARLANSQARGANGAAEAGEEAPLSHEETAEMVKEMVREAKEEDEKERGTE